MANNYCQSSSMLDVPKIKRAKAWNDDSIQFPRLLAEVYAIVMFTDEQLDELSESMDLPRERIYELFERAETKWEAIKAAI